MGSDLNLIERLFERAGNALNRTRMGGRIVDNLVSASYMKNYVRAVSLGGAFLAGYGIGSDNLVWTLTGAFTGYIGLVSSLTIDRMDNQLLNRHHEQ